MTHKKFLCNFMLSNLALIGLLTILGCEKSEPIATEVETVVSTETPQGDLLSMQGQWQCAVSLQCGNILNSQWQFENNRVTLADDWSQYSGLIELEKGSMPPTATITIDQGPDQKHLGRQIQIMYNLHRDNFMISAADPAATADADYWPIRTSGHFPLTKTTQTE